MGVPALAARALRVLGEGESCKQEEEQLGSPLKDRGISTACQKPDGDVLECWRQAAVPHLARLLGAAEGRAEGTSKQSTHRLSRLSSLNSSQRQSELPAFPVCQL